MFESINDIMQTTRSSLSISGITIASGLAALADIVPIFAALTGLILGIYTIVTKRRKSKRDESKAKADELRAQELHDFKVKIYKKDLNE